MASNTHSFHRYKAFCLSCEAFIQTTNRTRYCECRKAGIRVLKDTIEYVGDVYPVQSLGQSIGIEVGGMFATLPNLRDENSSSIQD